MVRSRQKIMIVKIWAERERARDESRFGIYARAKRKTFSKIFGGAFTKLTPHGAPAVPPGS